jgi:hypothetical protein
MQALWTVPGGSGAFPLGAGSSAAPPVCRSRRRTGTVLGEGRVTASISGYPATPLPPFRLTSAPAPLPPAPVGPPPSHRRVGAGWGTCPAQTAWDVALASAAKRRGTRRSSARSADDHHHHHHDSGLPPPPQAVGLACGLKAVRNPSKVTLPFKQSEEAHVGRWRARETTTTTTTTTLASSPNKSRGLPGDLTRPEFHQRLPCL